MTLTFQGSEHIPTAGETVEMVGIAGTRYAVTLHTIKSRQTNARGEVTLVCRATKRVLADTTTRVH